MSHLELVVPNTGEVLDLEDAASCLRVLGEIRELESRLREAKADLTAALAAEFSRQGTKTLELNGIKAELRGGTDIIWDIEVLEELREMGLPEARMNALITTEVTHRVNANEAKRIAAANPSYASVIERARKVIPKPSYVVLKGGGTDGGTERPGQSLDLRHGAGGHSAGPDPSPPASP